MASKEYTFSLLDPLSTLSLLEEISSLLCIDRPLFGEDHRRRVEEDVSKKKEVRKVESKDEKVEEEGNKGEEKEEEDRGNKGEEEEEERGLLTVVAATLSGKLVAHACIIASPARVSPICLG